jgi:hypothetical protein
MAQHRRRAAEQFAKGFVEAADAVDSATSAIDNDVSWINCLASSTRRVCATATGEAPTCR